MTEEATPVEGAPEGGAVEPTIETGAPVEVEGGEPVVPGAEEAAPVEPTTEAPAPVEFGGFRDQAELDNARALYEATRTEDGIIRVFMETGQWLGLTPDQMVGLFGSGEPIEPPVDDSAEPFTKGDWRAAQQAQEQAARAAQNAQLQATLVDAVAQEVADLKLEEGSPAYQAALVFGDKYLDKSRPSAENVRQAVRRGYADYQADIEAKAQAYLKGKVAATEQVPSAPAGTAPAGQPAPEPRNTAEAIKMARARRLVPTGD